MTTPSQTNASAATTAQNWIPKGGQDFSHLEKPRANAGQKWRLEEFLTGENSEMRGWYIRSWQDGPCETDLDALRKQIAGKPNWRIVFGD